ALMTQKIAVGQRDVLIAVDIQNDFCPGGSLSVPREHEVVPLINRLAERFNHVVLTQDWHPSDHLSFASEHPGRSRPRRSSSNMGHRFFGKTIAFKPHAAPNSIRICATAKPVAIKNLRAHDVKIRIMDDFAIIHAATSYTTPDGQQAHGRYTDCWAK